MMLNHWTDEEAAEELVALLDHYPGQTLHIIPDDHATFCGLDIDDTILWARVEFVRRWPSLFECVVVCGDCQRAFLPVFAREKAGAR